MEIETDWGAKIKVKDDPKTKEKIWGMLLDWYQKYDTFSMECLCQCDETNIDAPNLLGEIADTIFEYTEED